MKRYYIIDDADWPFGWPDADGKMPDIPFSDTRDDGGGLLDPRLRLQRTMTLRLSDYGGPAGKHLVVLIDKNGRPPASWDDKQLPHMLSGQPLTADQVAALAGFGVVAGDTAYHVGKKASKHTAHFHPHWDPA